MMLKRLIFVTGALLALPPFPLLAQSECGMAVANIAGVRVWSNQDLVIFTSGMTVDADGSPRAYHPQEEKGLDELSSAGRPGSWTALATVDGEPVIQGPDDPAPGFFVSTTSLADYSQPASRQSRYVDAEAIPFLALPRELPLRLGDAAIVINTNNGQRSSAIFADLAGTDHLGEGSIALAKNLGINPSARNGGIDSGIVYILFSKSGNGTPRSSGDIDQIARRKYSVSAAEAVECLGLLNREQARR